MLQKSRSMHQRTLRSRKKKIYSRHPIDKTRLLLKNFCFYDTWEGNIERCYQSPSMGWVLVCNQCFRSKISLSLDGVENLDKNGTQRELTTKKIEKYDNDGGSKSDQKYRSRVMFRQQKVLNEWKKPSIYNKIFIQSRYLCIIKILLIKSRSNFYRIFYHFCWRAKEFEFGQIPLFLNNK